jgi:hypothetical protein
MKLRIKSNSLRLRLSRSEIAGLLERDSLEETIRFAPAANARFSYSLRIDPSATAPTVRYSENRVEILLPVDRARTWALTDEVGIAEDISLGNFGTLALLIEKDFACLDRSEEDNEDTFPNPNAGTTCEA